jgi:hypothetical protein
MGRGRLGRGRVVRGLMGREAWENEINSVASLRT